MMKRDYESQYQHAFEIIGNPATSHYQLLNGTYFAILLLFSDTLF